MEFALSAGVLSLPVGMPQSHGMQTTKLVSKLHHSNLCIRYGVSKKQVIGRIMLKASKQRV